MAEPAAIPLTGWAERQVAALQLDTAVSGARSLSGRAKLGDFRIPGRVSAGGGCRMFDTSDGIVALNFSRSDDRELLPALFCDGETDVWNDRDIAAKMALSPAQSLVEQGRQLGLAISHVDERPASQACARVTNGFAGSSDSRRPLVVDLSALWAGPLAGRLLCLTGAKVVKVESRNRPDAMRHGDPRFYALLNQGKSHVALDLRDGEDRDALLSLIRRADIVIEAARPRALLQLGIDADALVREVPGLVWLTITGHGVAGDAANWVGFGDDCGVAGGLSAALRNASGQIGFVGDAIADPLTGIYAARMALEQRQRGTGARLVLSMSSVVAQALAEEKARDVAGLDAALRQWAAARGQAFYASISATADAIC